MPTGDVQQRQCPGAGGSSPEGHRGIRGQKISGRRCRSKRMGHAGHDIFRKLHVFKF